MRELIVTESSLKCSNLIYLQATLSDVLTEMNAKSSLKSLKNRAELKILMPSEYFDIFLIELLDKLADVIAINYKHRFFKKNIKFSGLSETEGEVLLTALISADVDEDKKYIIKKLKLFSEFSLDGIYNFRMKPLKEKWREITTYVPPSFTKAQLKDFIAYLIKDKRGRRVYVEGGKVFDKRFNQLTRVKLLHQDSEKLAVLKEILLSGAGEVELCAKISDKETKYLKEFFENKIFYSDSYFSLV